MPNSESDLTRRADDLYERYGKPLETKHWGQYVAIAEDGRTVLGLEFEELVRKAKQELGPGNFVFKVGERAVGNWR
jgi:hypothetical protein